MTPKDTRSIPTHHDVRPLDADQNAQLAALVQLVELEINENKKSVEANGRTISDELATLQTCVLREVDELSTAASGHWPTPRQLDGLTICINTVLRVEEKTAWIDVAMRLQDFVRGCYWFGGSDVLKSPHDSLRDRTTNVDFRRKLGLGACRGKLDQAIKGSRERLRRIAPGSTHNEKVKRLNDRRKKLKNALTGALESDVPTDVQLDAIIGLVNSWHLADPSDVEGISLDLVNYVRDCTSKHLLSTPEDRGDKPKPKFMPRELAAKLASRRVIAANEHGEATQVIADAEISCGPRTSLVGWNHPAGFVFIAVDQEHAFLGDWGHFYDSDEWIVLAAQYALASANPLCERRRPDYLFRPPIGSATESQPQSQAVLAAGLGGS